MTNKTLAFEIGTEELPAFDLHNVTGKLGNLATSALDEAKIPHGQVSVYTTPRRLIVVVADVPEMTEATIEEFRGPSSKIAFDENGAPTKAAIGFARSKGVDPSALECRDENGVEYVYAVKNSPSIDVVSLLPDLLVNLIVSIPWSKTQRWGSRREQFSRPIRWLLALLGTMVVPVEFAGLTSANMTYGHRFLAPGPHKVASADELIEVLRSAHVVPSEDEREAIIREQVKAIEAETGLVAELPTHTMQEVVNLTEDPTVMVGEFDKLFLAVPKEITVDAMLVHQRYFPLFNADGTLSNKFLITSNGDKKWHDNIVDGNQRVVAARLYDAKFFYDEDLKKPLEAYVDKLEEVVFQESLGTMRAKTNRVFELAGKLADWVGLQGQDRHDVERTAFLCKADLVTSAVIEFTSVQGIMGCYYAKASGETDRTAQAIADHYRPRYAGDNTPASIVGKVVATADKLDTICGLFAVGQAPTGSSDPFALRRNAIGVLAMLEDGLDIVLVDAIDYSLDLYRKGDLQFNFDEVKAEIIEFFVTRTKVLLRDSNIAADTIDAVLATGIKEPSIIVARAHALEDARSNDKQTFDDLATAYARANNLRDDEVGIVIDQTLLTEHSNALAIAIKEADRKVSNALAADDYSTALTDLAALRVPIDAFFENVMVMDDSEAVRINNLKLLNCFIAVFANVADFGKMAKG